MTIHNIEITPKNTPPADPNFAPLGLFFSAFLETATQPFAVAVERNAGLVSVFETRIHADGKRDEADRYFVERLVKFLLWSKGGYKVTLCGGPVELYAYIKDAYTPGGSRAFDLGLMNTVYEKPVEILHCSYDEKPQENEVSHSIGRHLNGCRIGFDAGGSDRKVSAVIDGEPVYSEEVVWHPKTQTDPDYHYNGILEAFKTAAGKMPRVDAIGVSSAGVYVGNRTMAASLFVKVPKEDFEKKVKDIYIRAAAAVGPDVPLEVANDGDVTALAGAMSLEVDRVLGIAMGTSQAGGYVDGNGNITGWLNELAFCPVDANPDAAVDEWSGDIGTGAMYFSQDAIIKMAGMMGLELGAGMSPGDKLKVAQNMMEDGDSRAKLMFESIGVYFGHTVPLYGMIYDMRHILMLGRVMSGKGGDLILQAAQRVLAEEYPIFARSVKLHLPDEKIRRVGQSVAAASLPET